jgi:hypothetical protein
LLAVYLALMSRCLQIARPSGIHDSKVWHLSTFIGWLVIGIILQVRAWISHGGRETIANSFHNIVVVSFLGYTVFSTLPLLGSTAWPRTIRILALLCLLGWLGLLLYDIRQGNLDKNTPMVS